MKNLALNRPESEERLMERRGAKAKAIWRAMVEHRSNEAVHKECCVELAKLTAKHQNVLKFFRLGTGEVILESMQNDTTSVLVQR